MSLYETKMPSLRDKLSDALNKEVPEVKGEDITVEEDIKKSKGRRLNK